MFNTHCHGIRKVPGRFGKKTAKNAKVIQNRFKVQRLKTVLFAFIG